LTPPAEGKVAEVSDGSSDSLTDFMNNFFTSMASDVADISTFLDQIEYQGFNASLVRLLAMQTFTPKGLFKLLAIAATRGSSAATANESSGGDKKLHAIGIELVSGSTKSIQMLLQGPELFAEKNSRRGGKTFLSAAASSNRHMTLQRLVAAFPDITACVLMVAQDSGRLSSRVDCELPPYLQVPAVAALPLHSDHTQKIDAFISAFSTLIGGTVDARIVQIQRNNQVQFTDNEIHQTLANRMAEDGFLLRE
jgi:hypothetical protein